MGQWKLEPARLGLGEQQLGWQLARPLHQRSLRLVQRLLERLLGKQLVRAARLGRGRLGAWIVDERLGLRFGLLQSVLYRARSGGDGSLRLLAAGSGE